MRGMPSYSTLALLAGGLIVAGAGLRHPPLVGDGAAQLGLVAATPAWRSVHLALMFGQVLLVAGIAGLALRHAATAGAGAARAGALLFAFGTAVALIQTLFMAAAAPALAGAYTRGEAGIAATQAIFTYDMLHPFAQIAGRAGEFAIGVALYSLGWGVVDGRVLPRGLGYAGVAAGVVSAVWAVIAHESHPFLMGGVALVVLWGVAAGAWLAIREVRHPAA
jgi:hypothetical protein